MPRLKWTPAALADIARMHAFLAGKNAAAARRAIKAIRKGAALLQRHPAAGRPLSDMPPEFRQWPIEFGADGYVILYHLAGHEDGGDEVVVLAVRHMREAGY